MKKIKDCKCSDFTHCGECPLNEFISSCEFITDSNKTFGECIEVFKTNLDAKLEEEIELYKGDTDGN